MQPLISIENLTIRFGNQSTTPAVHALNLEIFENEFIGLVGESGSGKSVTALSILQLLPQSPATFLSGKIWMHADTGERSNLMELQQQEIAAIRGKKIGMVFQEPMTSLNPLITVGEQIREVLKRHKKLTDQKAKEEALEWMKRVKLPEPTALYNRYPHQLSGGQKQRVLIAAAICCEPSLLICDEPTTALDVTVQREILSLIREEQKRTRMAVLFISHDLALVSEYADRVAVLYKGEQVELGKNPAIFQQPNHPYTKALLACRPASHNKGTRLPLVSDFLHPEAITPSPVDFIAKKTSERSPFMDVESLCVGYPMKKNWLSSKPNIQTILHDVSFSIQKGEMLGLVGESGSGKSTLGRTLLGLIKPTAGSIHHEGKDLLKIQPNHWPLKRQQLQLVFQDPYSSLNPRMTIGDAISEPLLVHGKVPNKKLAREQAMHWLDRVQLKPEHYQRYPHEFSGGQRQRIVIARALALEPAFVVCDESVSALDVSIQAQVLNLLNDLRRELGFTCLFISHDLGVVRYLCDRLIVLEQGRVVEWGDAETVCSTPQNPYTKRLLDSIPKLQSVG